MRKAAFTSPGFADLPFGSGFDAFQCTVNRITPEELFDRYDRCGFLYPAKRHRLQPYWGTICDTWRRTTSGCDGRSLHNVVVYEDPACGAWASVSYWATTNRSVHAQHLSSVGDPAGSRAVLLSAQSAAFNDGLIACQNWFRPDNRYPARVFGSCTHSLGTDRAAVTRCAYVSLDHDRLPGRPHGVNVHRCTDADAPAIDRLARRMCGPVQAQADEWASGDVNLDELDHRYRAAGLRRYRRVFIAAEPGRDEPVGLAVAYRGPLGLNFSFLENRCELWIDPHPDPERIRRTIAALAHAVADVYADFEVPAIHFTGDDFTGRVLLGLGAQPLQNYSRSVWLRTGFGAWYAHVNGLYARVMAAAARRMAGRAEAEAVP